VEEIISFISILNDLNLKCSAFDEPNDVINTVEYAVSSVLENELKAFHNGCECLFGGAP